MSKDVILIPVIEELRLLLDDLDYKRFKNTDRYIIAPDNSIQRKTIMVLMSRAFSHFYSLLNTSRSLQFKCLRKTYITSLFMRYGEATKAITHHTNIDVIKKHYLDKKPLLESIRDFKVFE